MVDERVHAVIQALYDAAMDETLWPEALRGLTGLTGSQGAKPSDPAAANAIIAVL